MKTQVSALCAGLPRPFNGVEMSAIDKRPFPALRPSAASVSKATWLRTPSITVARIWRYTIIRVITTPDGTPGSAGTTCLSDPQPSARTLSHKASPKATSVSAIASGWAARAARDQPAAQTVLEDRTPFRAQGHGRAHNQATQLRLVLPRVEEGGAQAGDMLERVEVGHEGWNVARVFAALYDPAHEPAPAQLRDGRARKTVRPIA